MNYTKKDFEKGQEVYVQLINNKHNELKYVTSIVTSLGLKYVTLNNQTKYNMENGFEKTDFTPRSRLFTNIEDLKKEYIKSKMIKELNNFNFNENNLTLEDVTTIYNILIK